MSHARIVLADDHELFREGLAGLINSQLDLKAIPVNGFLYDVELT